MKHTYIELNRRFARRSTYENSELTSVASSTRALGWEALLREQYCIVVAAANFGKTTEMRNRAARLRSEGKNAVFLALRLIAERSSLERALLPEELVAYKKWKTSANGQLTLFIDSLDEAASGRAEHVAHLLSEVAEEVRWPTSSVRWVISTRPAMLTPEILRDLASVLVQTTEESEAAPVKDFQADVAMGERVKKTVLPKPNSEATPVPIFSMLELEGRDATEYLNRKHGLASADKLLEFARRRGLRGFTSSPGGLDILARIDLISSPPDCLTEVYRRAVEAVELIQGEDHRWSEGGGPSADALRQTCELLAAASQVCQIENIELPVDVLEVPEKAISARLISASSGSLNELALGKLLNSQLFVDTSFYQVKIYPDELAPYLAAKRLSALAQTPERAHELLEHFTWRSPTGEKGVFREYMQLMGWLATFNAHCREELQAREPQALAMFGDLRQIAVPLASASAALTESIRRVVERGDRIGRGLFFLAPENYWQAGAPRLSKVLRTLFSEFGDHHVARDALLSIAMESANDALRLQVLKEHASNYGRLLESRRDARYILELRNPNDARGFIKAILEAQTPLDPFSVSVAATLGWDYLSPRQFALILGSQYGSNPKGRRTLTFSQLSDVRELLARTDAADAYLFGRAFIVLLCRRSRRFRKSGGRTHRGAERFLDIASTVLARLVREPGGHVNRVAQMCLLTIRILEHVHGHYHEVEELREALHDNVQVRRSLLAMVVRWAQEDNVKLWGFVFSGTSLWSVTSEDVEAVGSPSLSALFAARQATAKAPVKEQKLSSETRRNRVKLNRKSKTALQKDLEGIRTGTNLAALGWIAGWLLQTNPHSRYGEVDFEVFAGEAGEPLASAARLGLTQCWRVNSPKFDEDETNSTYHSTIAGLQGLHIELGSGDQLPELSDAEVERAIKFARFEINGYPKWFWPLAGRHERLSVRSFSQLFESAGDGALSRAHAEELLASLVDAPPTIRFKVAPSARLLALPPKSRLRPFVLERTLSWLTDVPGGLIVRDFEGEVLAFVQHVFEGQEASPSAPDDIALALAWMASWLCVFPNSFQKRIDGWGRKNPTVVRTVLRELAAHLGADRSGMVSRMVQENESGVQTLGHLYEWTMWAVPPEGDLIHPEGQAYSVGPLDHAARFRDSIISVIASAKSELAYQVLSRLRTVSVEPRASYIRTVQFDMREMQARQAPLGQKRYSEFEQRFRIDITDTSSFAAAIQRDLLAVKYDIERGEHSLRRFFSAVALPRKRLDGKLDEAALALEADFQRLLASDLYHRSKDDYSVVVEPHTAEQKRRDILCSTTKLAACIELKMSRRWTLADYIEALEKQLVGQYMRHRRATIGFLVLVLQDRARTWKDVEGKRRIGFRELVQRLETHALQLSAKNRTLFIRVIGIDATEPTNFRKPPT